MRKWILLTVAIGMTGCLPAELTDAELSGWCATADDCQRKPTFACWISVCTANQCVKQGAAKPATTDCHTDLCPTGCKCSAPKSPVGPGICGKPLTP